jgi:hypothetical protein
MVMQQTLRPYAAAGVALVGAGLIAAAVTSVPAPSPGVPVVHTPVQLIDSPEDTLISTLISDVNTDFTTLESDLTSDFSALDSLLSTDLSPLSDLSTIATDLGKGGTLDTDLGNLLSQLNGDFNVVILALDDIFVQLGGSPAM